MNARDIMRGECELTRGAVQLFLKVDEKALPSAFGFAGWRLKVERRDFLLRQSHCDHKYLPCPPRLDLATIDKTSAQTAVVPPQMPASEVV